MLPRAGRRDKRWRVDQLAGEAVRREFSIGMRRAGLLLVPATGALLRAFGNKSALGLSVIDCGCRLEEAAGYPETVAQVFQQGSEI